MIIYQDTNLLLSPAQTLVNTVNTVGVMGAGIAKEFKRYYPKMFVTYRKVCRAQLFEPGQLLLYKGERGNGYERKRWVLNFPTKRDWRDPSELAYVEQGLVKFVTSYKAKGITSIAFPPLGTGCGGLKWPEVKQLMESYLKQVDIPVYIHIYRPTRGQETKDSEIVRNLGQAATI